MDRPKTFGLNMIVGAGEADILARCLDSVKAINFDEIIITHATKQIDQAVMDTAKRYTDNVYTFDWIDDFSAARNAGFEKSEAYHIMWLDSDDVLSADQVPAINALIPKLKDLDIVFMDYAYSHDDAGKPALVLPRERIVRNMPEIRWHDPIHEYLNITDPGFRLTRTQIRIDHYRIKPFDPSRNVPILKKEYAKDADNARIAFYYGKELADMGNWEEALPVLERFASKGEGYVDNLTVGCIRLAGYYMSKKMYKDAAAYAMLGIRYNPIYAECYVTLAACAEEEKDYQRAVDYLKQALTKTLTGGMSQIVDYYGFLPAMKLAIIFHDRKEYDEALRYIDVALKHKPGNSDTLKLKDMIEKDMQEVSSGSTLSEGTLSKMKKVVEDDGLIMRVLANDGERASLKVVKKVAPSVIWLLSTDDPTNPSTRLRRLIISSKLEEKGIKSKVYCYAGKSVEETCAAAKDSNVVVMACFGPNELAMVRSLKRDGKKICFDHCEALFGHPYENECMQESDAILCCSTKLEEMTKAHGFKHTVVLKDSVEDRQPKVPVRYREVY